jgi:hypothetical protein
VPSLLPRLFGLRVLCLAAICLTGSALVRGVVGSLWPDHTMSEALLRSAVTGLAGLGLFVFLAPRFGLGRESLVESLAGRLRRVTRRSP